ncbi:GNAT family N-acetyltransferase [Hoeflea sp.]|uniref:GNAT family N-acetyltransferase n=1 Tax=Hoeflea sp. TaxID=1940281 RepID=UPI003748067A
MRRDLESSEFSAPSAPPDSISPEARPPTDAAPHCPVLLSESLVLRAPHAEDIDALAILADNPAIATMLSRMPHPYGRTDAEAFVNASAKRENGNCVYAITEADTGRFLGCCSLETGKTGNSLELGYWVGEPFWGRGIATEAAHALIAMAFRTRDIDHIDARCRVTNPASRRVLQKSGFQFQGTEMHPMLALNASVSMEWFRLDRKTWMSLMSWSHQGR